MVLTQDSADALARVQSVEPWLVAPTMLRGAKKVPDMLGLPKKKEAKIKALKKVDLVEEMNPKKKPDVPEVNDLTHKDFRRSQKGAQNMKLKLDHLYQLDREAFPNNPTFDFTTGKCRMKYEPAQQWTWPEMREVVAVCMDQAFLACTMLPPGLLSTVIICYLLLSIVISILDDVG